jgi:inorganic pyrophosphatase
MNYWESLEQLVADSKIVIDRPKGSRHPKMNEIIYPMDYGYLDGTGAIDGGGIDIWIGSKSQPKVEGIITTVDLYKRDAEIKIMFGCTQEEITNALETQNFGKQAARFIQRT